MSDSLSHLNAVLEDRYRVERDLGEGGAATVYLAWDIKHQRNVALKVLKPAAAERINIDRFSHEIEIVAGLTHPHILPLHDSGDVEGLPFFVMPYIDGGTLRDSRFKVCAAVLGHLGWASARGSTPAPVGTRAVE